MGKKIKEIDAFIQKSAEFAQPILIHLRKLVHDYCPEVEEKIKWGMPHFEYKSETLCYMSAFKKHCAFGFYKAPLMKDPVLMNEAKAETAMGHLGRISSLKDLPSDSKMTSWIKEAMALTDKGVKLPLRKKTDTTSIEIPEAFQKALQKNRTAKANFEKMPPSHKREYIGWITEAKTEPTREKRISTSIEWLSENKSRNWKYEKKQR
ncbi:MAG TPA: hypothetical protein DCQ34_06355 [Chitinophagaceae bacterium]|nr:hypothetical protein [Chitinophagaceae bacterium]HCY88670.1 hypothetical protein [Chitinophagaceae bacterium]HRF25965.1 YdeI/OmpD-associated family protein [Ferruginibacter sp.]